MPRPRPMPRPSAILLYGGLDLVFPVGVEEYETLDVGVDIIVIREGKNEVVEDNNDSVADVGRNPIVPAVINMPLEAQHDVLPTPQQ